MALSLAPPREPDGMSERGCPVTTAFVSPKSQKTFKHRKACKGSTTARQQAQLSMHDLPQDSQPAGTCGWPGPLLHTPAQHHPQPKYGGRSPGRRHDEFLKQGLNRLYCYKEGPTKQSLINQYMWSQDVTTEKLRGHDCRRGHCN